MVEAAPITISPQSVNLLFVLVVLAQKSKNSKQQMGVGGEAIS